MSELIKIFLFAFFVMCLNTDCDEDIKSLIHFFLLGSGILILMASLYYAEQGGNY